MRVKRLIAVVVALFMAVAAAGCTTTVSQVKILRLSINQTAKHPSTIALQHMSERVSKATNGRVRIDIYPNETLGAQAETLQLVKAGIVDMAVISGTQMENLNKDFTVVNLPGMFDSVDQQLKVVNDNPVMNDLYGSVRDTWNMRILGGFTQGTRSLYTRSDKTIKTPADLGNMKVRVQESAMMVAMVRAMNGSPTPMAYGEVYTALQAGVLDAAENNEVSYHTAKHYEVAKHYWQTNHLVGLDYVVINDDLYEGMAPDVRAAFDKAWTETYLEHAELWKKATEEAITAAKDGGATFHTVDNKAFKAALEKVAPEFTKTESSKKLYEAMKVEAAKYAGKAA